MKAALPDRIPARVLFREIKERGYEGGETRVKLFVRGLTPLPAATRIVRACQLLRRGFGDCERRKIQSQRIDSCSSNIAIWHAVARH